jgi:molybdopterin-guanine dinucleotide biosynthesis protein A
MLRLQLQVGHLIINANRNLAAYEAMGVPVWPDPLGDYPGPLAGLLAGLEHCDTPYLVTVPCDTPNFPADLVARLAQALHLANADIAMAAAPEEGALRTQPVFLLLKTSLLESLVAALHEGERKVDRWTARHACVTVPFDDGAAFFNANTLDELARLQRS